MKLERRKIFLGLACLLSLTLMVGNALAANLVVNGDFESGNTGFTSAYTYVATPGDKALYPEGAYAIGGDPRDFHDQWTSFPPQQGDLMMIVNGFPEANQLVWGQSVAVVPNTTYYFSAYIASNHPANPAVLAFSINNTLLGSPLTASATTGQWDLFYATWNSGSIATADLALVNQNTTKQGNDFSLDNIKMDTQNPTAPLPSSILLLGPSLAGLGLLRFRKKI